MCNPEIEQCSPNSNLVRPDSSDLLSLLLIYFANFFIFPISAIFMRIIAGLFDHNLSEDWDLGDGIIYVWLYWLHLFTWIIPTITLIFYLVFGANFFLFAWTDNLSLYFITDATSRWSFIIHAFVSFYSLYSGVLGTLEAFLIFLSYTLMAGWLEY